MVIHVLAIFMSFQVLFHLISCLHFAAEVNGIFAAEVNGIDTFLVLFLHMRKLSL